MKIFALIFCIFPVGSFASSENVEHVFIKAFQAAMASSLCTDVANITKDTQPEKELEGNDSNLLIVFYVQIMPDDFVMQLHRF